MATNYIHEAHVDFSGGVNQYPGSLLKADNETDKIENGELVNFGPIKKTRGYTQRGDEVALGYDVLGLCTAYKSDGTRKQIAIADEAASSDAYTYNPTNGAWTAHGLSLTTGSKAEFESFLDGFFMVNFTEATRWNDLTQWYTTTNVTDAPKAKYIKQYLSRVYTAYCVDGATTYPSRVIYSNLPSGTPMTITWDNTVNYFDVDTDDGDKIMGLGMNSNRLLIFKENSLHRYDTNTRYVVPGCPGTTSQRSVVNIQGWTIYLHSSGIWGYDGSTSKLLSRAVKDIIEGVSFGNLYKASGFGKGDHYYIYLGDISNTKVGLTIDKCLLDYDVSKNAFSWRSLGKEPLVWQSYRNDIGNLLYNDATTTYGNSNITYNGSSQSEDVIYFGASDGVVYQIDNGRTYDGENISFTIETKDYYLGNPSLFKLLHRIVVFSDSGRQVYLQFKTDNNDWKTLGRINQEINELTFPSGTRCRKIKFRITESSSGDPFSFEGFDIYFTPETLSE